MMVMQNHRMYQRIIRNFCIFISTLFLVPNLYADPLPLMGGENPRPFEETDIILEKERLFADINWDKAMMDVELTLHNSGKKKEIQVGFPCDQHFDDIINLPCKNPPQVIINGKKISVKKSRVPSEAKQKYFTWSIGFEQDERKIVKIQYQVKVINERYTVPFSGIFKFSYHLITGASWAGPIGELDMTVKYPIDLITYIQPEGYERQSKHLTWHLKDYEPREDLEVYFHPMLNSRYIYSFKTQGKGKVLTKSFENAEAACEVKPDELKRVIEQLKKPEMIEMVFDASSNFENSIKPNEETRKRMDMTLDESIQLLSRCLKK